MTSFRLGALLCPALVGFLTSSAFAQLGNGPVRARITRPINEGQLSRLAGNTHRLAKPQFDRGPAPPDLPMDRMLLVLTRSSQQEGTLQNLLKAQQDRKSAFYHQWLTPQQFGEQFGAATHDVQTVTAWLESHGFRVDRISNGRSIIEFSGTAGQVKDAFHTEIHQYIVNGKTHWANASDPEIPSALAGVIAGVATLHNFRKKPQLIRANGGFRAAPEFTGSNGTHALSPADYATIYDINPLYNAGIDGTGTVIAVVGRSNINAGDIASFRSTFGLSDNPPVIVPNGPAPGNLGGDEEAEAVLDTTWAGAVAPGATVKLVISAGTNTTDGVDLSELYIIDNNFGDVMTESFGQCEAAFTSAEAAATSSLAEQAAAQGITYTVAAGDSGAEGCDDPSTEPATGPISVNLLASTPYTIAVGGTQFNEGGNDAAYWQSSNDTNGSSVIQYIPENVWNESCTSARGNCTAGNSPGLWAGGGGASTFFAKPAWQTGVAGIPNDGMRDVPDISLTAAGHDAYLLCLDGSCTPNSTGRISFDGYSGTSAATPSFAGVMALIVQQTGSRQGQADTVLYRLAASKSSSSCNASNAAALPATTCIFNDVTAGNNAVPGESGYGTSSALYQATAGYDLATGLGSVNVTNLVNAWNGVPNTSWEFHVTIDQPGVQQSTFLGFAQFSGSALNAHAAVTTVRISIDGVPYGNAGYGFSRPDVCAAYPDRIGCPNVGWAVTVDTTQLADGMHTLEVLATSALGNHASQSATFTVANWSSNDPMIVDIDSPSSSSPAFTGLAGFGGWAIDQTGTIASVSVSVDGVPVGDAGYGGSRADVCAVYPVTGCPNVGWNIGVDTTILADGTHTVAVTGVTAAGQNTTVTKTFTTANLSGSPLLIDIDTPSGQGSTFSGPAHFGGWALDNNAAISNVAVSVDGVFVENASYGATRNDVCTILPGRPGCPYVGWNAFFNTTKVANGSHMLEITVTAANGQRATQKAPFTVANSSSASPLKLSIDQPSSQNGTVTGSAAIVGWAVDDNGPISSIAISVDGVQKGNASYGGSRPDVCAAFPGTGCPNVGWAFWLDTTLLPNGTHTLAATATPANGDQITISASFTVANWTSGNPMKINIDVPNSNSTPFSGSVVFGGWAVSSISAIQNVKVAIDGVPAGSGNYGVQRADVCAAFPDTAGCPNVGWNLGVDTTQLANGQHTLAVTAMSSGGQASTVTANFNVSNSGTIVIDIDQPNSNGGIFSGSAPFGGWTVDTTNGATITAVKILVDGVFNGLANYGVSRPDVCAVYTNAGGCPNVGWNYLLDTTVLGNGTHTLDITAVSSTGKQATSSSSFTVAQ